MLGQEILILPVQLPRVGFRPGCRNRVELGSDYLVDALPCDGNTEAWGGLAQNLGIQPGLQPFRFCGESVASTRSGGGLLTAL